MSNTLYRRLFAHLETRPDHEAFRFGERWWTYGELTQFAAYLADVLNDEGVQRGDRVAVLTSRPEMMVGALVANYVLGTVHLPLNTKLTSPEIHFALEDSEARVIIADGDHPFVSDDDGHAVIRTLRTEKLAVDAASHADRANAFLRNRALASTETVDSDTALLIYTSGTTGRPKGVVLSYRAVVSGMLSLTNLWEWSPADDLVLALPLFHVHGLGIGVHGSLLQGNRCRVLSRFRANDIVDEIADGASIFMGVPTMYDLLLEHLRSVPDAATTLRAARLFTSGSAALPSSRFREFEQFTGHRILERYGMSETMLTLSNPYRGERMAGTVGRPVPGIEVAVLDEQLRRVNRGETGELFVRGDFLFDRYWKREEATRDALRDGWFRTGDIVRQNAAGYFEIVGRKSSDILKTGGYKVSAREIEDVIRDVPRVRDVAVVGLPDERWGQLVAAFVVSEGVEPGELESAIADAVGAQLADYKRPRQVNVVDELPRNALGKVQKHRLAEGRSRP